MLFTFTTDSFLKLDVLYFMINVVINYMNVKLQKKLQKMFQYHFACF